MKAKMAKTAKMKSRIKKNRKARRGLLHRAMRYLSTRLLWRRRLKAMIPTPQEIDSFRVLNEMAIDMENKIKPELFRLHKDLMMRLDRGEIDDFEIEVVIEFYLNENHHEWDDGSDNIIGTVEFLASDPTELDFLEDCSKDYNELRGNRFFSLRSELICYPLWNLLRNLGEKQHQIFHCGRVWADIRPIIQFVEQHPLDTGERFQTGKVNK